MASLDFCLVVLQVAWLFNSPACSSRVQLLAACKSQASCEIQPRVPASLHSLEHFFTLSHTLLLHDSHLNTRFLSAVLQANLSRYKANTWLIKCNLTSCDLHDSYSEPLWMNEWLQLSFMTTFVWPYYVRIMNTEIIKKLLQYLLNMEHLCFFFKEYGAYLFMAYIAELFEPYGPLDYASQ